MAYVCVAAILLAAIIIGSFLLVRAIRKTAATPAVVQPMTSAGIPEKPPVSSITALEQEKIVLDRRVDEIQGAFQRKDSAAIKATHPVRQAHYKEIFEKHQGELGRVAQLPATRKLIAIRSIIAEYEVTENGKTFGVTFEKLGDQWYLAKL